MAALTLPSLSSLTGWPIHMESWTHGEPQGREDKQLREQACAALAHWGQRTEILLWRGSVAAGDYESVPFEPVRILRVTYQHAGEFKPPPYRVE
jgi:hypothetical protein